MTYHYKGYIMFKELRELADEMANEMGVVDDFGRFEFFTEPEVDLLIKTQALINKAQAAHSRMNEWAYFSWKEEVQEIRIMEAYKLAQDNLDLLRKNGLMRIRARR